MVKHWGRRISGFDQDGGVKFGANFQKPVTLIKKYKNVFL